MRQIDLLCYQLKYFRDELGMDVSEYEPIEEYGEDKDYLKDACNG